MCFMLVFSHPRIIFNRKDQLSAVSVNQHSGLLVFYILYHDSLYS